MGLTTVQRDCAACDESTDIQTRTELSVCFRYISDGEATEAFFCLQQAKATDSKTVSDAILTLVKEHKIPLCNIYWIAALDGAANMATLRQEMTNAHYIHCRNHLLHLAAANIANDFKTLRSLFSSFNSLWKFFHNLPKKLGYLDEIRSILDDPVLQLVRAGDTRWTSNYRALRAIRVSLRAIIYALQKIHAASGDLSSEAGGLLLVYQDKQSLLLIFAIEQILMPLNTLTLSLQSPKLSLSELPIKIKMATDRLHEIEADRNTYVALFEDFMTQEGFPTTGSEVNYSNVHEQIVVKYIQSLCRNMEQRFGDSIGQISVVQQQYLTQPVLSWQ